MPESRTAVLPRRVDVADVPVGGYADAFVDIPDDWDEKTALIPDRRDDLGG